MPILGKTAAKILNTLGMVSLCLNVLFGLAVLCLLGRRQPPWFGTLNVAWLLLTIALLFMAGTRKIVLGLLIVALAGAAFLAMGMGAPIWLSLTMLILFSVSGAAVLIGSQAKQDGQTGERSQ